MTDEQNKEEADKGKKPIVKEEIEELQKRVAVVEKRLEELPLTANPEGIDALRAEIGELGKQVGEYRTVVNQESVNALKAEIGEYRKEVGEYKATIETVGKKCDEVLKYFHAIGDEEKVTAILNKILTKEEIDSFLGSDESEDLLADSEDDIDGLFPDEKDKGVEPAPDSAYDTIKRKVREAVNKSGTRFSATGPLNNYIERLAKFAEIENSEENFGLLKVYLAERITGGSVMGKTYRKRKDALSYLESREFSDKVKITL